MVQLRSQAHVLTTVLWAAGFARLVPLLVATAVFLVPKPASAAQPWVFDARIGPALLLKSQSHAPRHLFKPDVRLGARLAWSERWELGAAVDALVDPSEHYRVLGLLAHARFAPIEFGPFSLGTSAALGAGYDADILHSNLDATGSVTPYWFVALDGRWQVGRWLFGVEGGVTNVAIVQLGALVGVRFAD